MECPPLYPQLLEKKLLNPAHACIRLTGGPKVDTQLSFYNHLFMDFSLSYSDTTLRVSSLGAEIQSLRRGGREYIYQKVSGFWQRQSPILFPIVGALCDGKYMYQGKEYSLPQHGFARDSELSLRDQGEHFLEFILRNNSSTWEVYPFHFSLTVRYTLGEDTCDVEYTLTNPDRELPLLASLGGHPAFALDADISDYSLFFPQDHSLQYERLDHGLLDTGQCFSLNLQDHILPLSESLFAQDALIFRSLQSREIHLLREGDRVLSFDRGDFPFLALWKQTDAPFLCLEPWQGHADIVGKGGEISEKSGILSIAPGSEWKGKWRILLPSVP